jgi:tetratricopeptide (TPR) repeat protein
MVRSRTIGLMIALVTVLAYLPLRHAGLVVFDDPIYIGDAHVRAGFTWAGVKWAFTTWHASNWHPLTWLSLMLDASLFGPDAGKQHLINVWFHAANALLLFLLLVRTTEKMWTAAFVAGLFALHPLHVESVAWLSERKDVLSTFFGLLALLAYARYAERSKVQGPKSKVCYAQTLGLFALSLMAKPMLVTLPFVLLLLDIWPLGRIQIFGIGDANSATRNPQHATRTISVSHLLIEKLPFFVLTVASSIVTFLAQRSEAVVSLEQRPFGLRLANALVSYAEYLGKMVWPTKLAVIYPLPNQIPVWQILVAVVVVTFISLLAWSVRKNAPYLLIGWLWFLGTLVPVIGLVQVGGQALADRYTYVPLIGVFIAIAYGIDTLKERFRFPQVVVSAAAGVVLVACLLGTEYQLQFWQDSQKLFAHAVTVTKDNAIAHINLGVALEQEDRQPEALAEYRKAIDIEPNRFQARNNVANLLASMGLRDEAYRQYQEALRLNPGAAVTHINLATLLSEMGRFNDAMNEYKTAVQLDPDDPRPYYLMGKACLRVGQSAEALKHFRDALQRDANDFETLTWLARVLAADENPAVRNGAEAISAAERAANLTGGGQPFVLDTLAMAYAEAGRFKDAQTTVERALQIAAMARTQKTVPEMQQRLQLYQNGKPYRENFAKTP